RAVRGGGIGGGWARGGRPGRPRPGGSGGPPPAPGTPWQTPSEERGRGGEKRPIWGMEGKKSFWGGVFPLPGGRRGGFFFARAERRSQSPSTASSSGTAE